MRGDEYKSDKEQRVAEKNASVEKPTEQEERECLWQLKNNKSAREITVSKRRGTVIPLPEKRK